MIRCCYILLELLIIGLSEYNARSMCRDTTEWKRRRRIFREDLRRWRRLKWHSCGGLWIKDESFDLAPSFLSPVAHLNYYRGGLEENRVSKVHTKEELMWECSRKFFIFNTWRTMTDTSESNRVPKHKVTSQYAEAQPTFHAVLSLKKSAQVSWRTSINHAWRAMASFNT